MDDFSSNDNEYQEADRVILNVGGIRFETYITTLQNIADTRLAWLTEGVEGEPLCNREFFFDRHPGVFVHILNFYRTGKLHTPRDMCGPAFEEELQFWGIDEKQMEPCCWESFTKHREAEGNLRTFEGPGFEDLNLPQKRKYSTIGHDDNCCFGQRMNTLWDILNDPHSSELAKRFSLLSCAMIIISLSVYCLMTMKDLKKNDFLSWINRTCLVFFTIEFVMRVVICPDRIAFVKDYKNWIDFLSIIPSILLIPFADKKWIHNLVIIRLLRVFKFFKLSYGLQVLIHTLKASSYELTLLLLILLIPLVVFSSLVYALEEALLKDPSVTNHFDSIPRTFWWCIITMTTVGYGDITPKTWAGQMIGSICAIIGVLIIALPISVIGNNFTLYYAHVRARLKLPKKNRNLLQGRLRGLLRQPAMLSSRDRDRKTIKRNGSSLMSTGDRLTVNHTPSPYHLQLRRQRESDITLDLIDVDAQSVISYEKEQTNSSIDDSKGKINQNNNSNNNNKNNNISNNNKNDSIYCKEKSRLPKDSNGKIDKNSFQNNEQEQISPILLINSTRGLYNSLLIDKNHKTGANETLTDKPQEDPTCYSPPSSNISLLTDTPPSPAACLPATERNSFHFTAETLECHIRRESMQRVLHYSDFPPVPPRTRSKTVDSANALFLLEQSRLKPERQDSISNSMLNNDEMNSSNQSSLSKKSTDANRIDENSSKSSKPAIKFFSPALREKQLQRSLTDCSDIDSGEASSREKLSTDDTLSNDKQQMSDALLKESGV